MYMKVVVIKKTANAPEHNPVTVPMEGIEALIAEKEAAEQKVVELQEALQAAHIQIEHLQDEVCTIKESLNFVNEERRKMLDKLTSNNSTEGCPKHSCLGDCADHAHTAVRRVFLVYI